MVDLSDDNGSDGSDGGESSDDTVDEVALGPERAFIVRMLRDPKNKFINTVDDLYTTKNWKQAQAVYHPDHNDGDGSKWDEFNTAKEWFNEFDIVDSFTPAEFKEELGL